MQWLLLLCSIGWAEDSLRIDPRKRLRPYELSRKREKWVIVGYPTAGYDALRGFGTALALSIAYNGLRTDPLFAYQPYKHYLFTQGGFFQRESQYFRLLYDIPWIGSHPYRLTARLGYRRETQGQFWGLGSEYLNRTISTRTLPQYERLLKTPSPAFNGQWETQIAYHYFQIIQWQGWLIGERIAHRGLLRYLGGVRWLSEEISPLSGRAYSLKASDGTTVQAIQAPTLLDSAVRRLIPLPRYVEAYAGRWSHRPFIGGAIVWDSRDFEISPSQGWLIEAGHESRLPSFSTHKTYISLRQYHTLFQSRTDKVQFVGAAHLLLSATYGPRIFFTDLYYYSRWSEGRSINLLTGPSTVRAFRENRFVTALAYLFQYELRSRIAEVRLLRQHFAGGPIAFLDIAGGADELSAPLPRTCIIGAGVGARILWNMTTMLRADIAYGREGWQLHFTTGHAF